MSSACFVGSLKACKVCILHVVSYNAWREFFLELLLSMTRVVSSLQDRTASNGAEQTVEGLRNLRKEIDHNLHNHELEARA